MRKKKSALGAILRGLLLPAAAAVVLVGFASALSGLDSGREEEGKRQLEEALRRACVACYAVEGVYPQDLAYLQENYGVQVDEAHYTVMYNIFAENLMPDITVLEKKP